MASKFSKKNSSCLGLWRRDKHSMSSVSNLSDTFLDTIEFKSEKKLGGGYKPVYKNKDADVRKRSLSKKRRPIRGQMGTYLPAETAEERRARLQRENQKLSKDQEHNNNENDVDGGLKINEYRRHQFEGEMKELKSREILYEIPAHSVMKVNFLGLVTHSKWHEALQLCKRFIALQPENKIYKDFKIILQAMVIFNDSPKTSIMSSKSSISFEFEMAEDELVELTDQLQIQEDARK